MKTFFITKKRGNMLLSRFFVVPLRPQKWLMLHRSLFQPIPNDLFRKEIPCHSAVEESHDRLWTSNKECSLFVNG